MTHCLDTVSQTALRIAFIRNRAGYKIFSTFFVLGVDTPNSLVHYVPTLTVQRLLGEHDDEDQSRIYRHFRR